MAPRVAPIAKVRLARSLPRLLGMPVILLLGGVALGAYGAVGAPMPAGIALVAAGGAVALAGLAWAAWLLSIRFDVEEAAVRVHWLGGERRYVLTPGPVTRVRLRGEGASSLRARTALLGWQLGPATLRDEEQIEIVRLAPTATAILVPTEGGRLAIAAESEDQLIDALTHAARARKRMEEIAQREEPPAESASAPPAAMPAADNEPEPRFMTGIERAAYERHLAEERRAVEARLALEADATAAAPLAEEAQAAVAEPTALPTTRRGFRGPRVARPGTALVFAVLPLLAAGAAWGVGLVTGRMPEPGTDLGRLTSLALVLAGPATSVGAIMARAWWPRTVGVIVAGGLAASVLIARALLGPLD